MRSAATVTGMEIDPHPGASVTALGISILLPLLQQLGSRSVTRRGLASRVERLQKGHQRSRLRRTRVLSVGRHIATTLNHLPDELILREPHRHLIERRAALATRVAERVAVAALFGLENQRSLPLQRASA